MNHRSGRRMAGWPTDSVPWIAESRRTATSAAAPREYSRRDFFDDGAVHRGFPDIRGLQDERSRIDSISPLLSNSAKARAMRRLNGEYSDDEEEDDYDTSDEDSEEEEDYYDDDRYHYRHRSHGYRSVPSNLERHYYEDEEEEEEQDDLDLLPLSYSYPIAAVPEIRTRPFPKTTGNRAAPRATGTATRKKRAIGGVDRKPKTKRNTKAKSASATTAAVAASRNSPAKRIRRVASAAAMLK